jgi:hypothetical protein
MNPHGRLLPVEMVLPSGDTPHPGKMLDMVMLVVPGGEERTAAEYGALLDKGRLPADSGGADGFACEHRRSHPLLRPGEAYRSFFKLPSNTCQLPPPDLFETGFLD